MKGYIVLSVILPLLFCIPLSTGLTKDVTALEKGNLITTLGKWIRFAEPGKDKSLQRLELTYLHYWHRTTQDFKIDIKLLTVFAEKGDADAQYKLATMYAKGEGVPQSHETAVQWITLAAEQGHTKALSCLGVIYLKGVVVPQNYPIAIKALTQAAEQGDTVAQYNLGVMYAEGDGVSQDYKTAMRYFKLVAEKGNGEAQKILGLMHYYGDGTIQNYTRAYMWFDIAASQGSKFALEFRDHIQIEMTPAEVSKAKELARQCLAKNFKDC